MKIIGKSECTAEQMARYLISKNPMAVSFALEYARLYLEEGEVEGVRGDGAWVQSMKETHNFLFDCGTAVTFDQNNFCGLGVTQKGMKGASFDTPRLGIRAQIQHLKGYASAEPLAHQCVDPRYSLIIPKGKAPTFEELAGKWAHPGYDTTKASSLEDAMNKHIGYGFDIVNGVEAMKQITEGATNMSILVAIDAGHGSNTSGKRTPDGYREHWINVMTAKHCEAYLNANGIKTLRVGWNDENAKDDSDVSLTTRQNQIKAAKCDYSVSVHANANGSGSWDSASGIETYVHNNTAYQNDSLALAKKVQIELVKGTKQKDRGVKTKALAMCNCKAMGTKASILCEIGFMTNKAEADLMKTGNFCKEQGEDIARGVLAYIGKATTSAPSTSTSTTTKPTTNTGVKFLHNGIDYSPVFNAEYYANRYADLKAAFSNDASKLFDHFIRYGMMEGRQGIDTFNVHAYKSKNADLQQAFGNNLPKYYEHYCTYGKNEHRACL